MKIIKSIFSSYKNSKTEILFLFLIFVSSFIIRCIGLRFSFPLITYWNELNILDPVYEMTKNRTLNPDNFRRPDQILYFLNLIYLNIISFIKTGHSFAGTYQTNPYDYFVYSRIMIAAFGSLIPIVAYKIGKENVIDYSVPAALLFAFFPVYVLYSHYVGPDIPITLFTLVIILFSIRYIRKLDIKYLYLATIFAAINTAEKYPGLISLGIVFFAIIWVKATKFKTNPKQIIKYSLIECIKFFGFFILALLIIAPNLFIHFEKVVDQINLEARSSHLGADGLGWFGNASYYLAKLFKYSNIVIIFFAIAGLVGMKKEKNFEVLPCFYGLVYWICLSVLPLHWERWSLPMLTFPLLLAAFGYGFLFNELNLKKGIKLVITILFSLSMVWSLLFSFSISIRMTYTDTRVAALRYCEKSGITMKNSIYEGYTPFVPGGPGTFNLSKINSRTKYILISSLMYDRFYNEPTRYHKEVDQYEIIKKRYPLITSFSPSDPENPIEFLSWADDLRYYLEKQFGKKMAERFTGPTIQIYIVD